MGYGRLADLAHRTEHLLDAIRAGRAPAGAGVVDLLLKASRRTGAGRRRGGCRRRRRFRPGRLAGGARGAAAAAGPDAAEERPGRPRRAEEAGRAGRPGGRGRAAPDAGFRGRGRARGAGRNPAGRAAPRCPGAPRAAPGGTARESHRRHAAGGQLRRPGFRRPVHLPSRRPGRANRRSSRRSRPPARSRASRWTPTPSRRPNGGSRRRPCPRRRRRRPGSGQIRVDRRRLDALMSQVGELVVARNRLLELRAAATRAGNSRRSAPGSAGSCPTCRPRSSKRG